METQFKISANANITDQIIKQANLTGEKESFYRDLIDNFLKIGDGQEGSDIFAVLVDLINQTQEKISYYLNEIIHHQEFRKVEASWGGLFHLIKESDVGGDLKIKVLDINMDRLYRDISRVMEFDQSSLFKSVYEEEYGTFGGEPYSCIVVDYYMNRTNKDFDFVSRLAQVFSAAHVPGILSIHAGLFDLKTMADLNVPRDLSKIFEGEEMLQWNAFRSREESKYICLVLPRVLGRLPYSPEKNPVQDVNFFKEIIDPELLSWQNAAYYFALNITKSYKEYGWMSAIRGVENGGKVEDLPIFTFKSFTGEMAIQCPTEVTIPDRAEKEISDLGMICLCNQKKREIAVFFGSQTAHKPKIYNKAEATANSRISCNFSYLSNVCRFAHYIKAIMRDKIGQYADRASVETFLNNWIADYVILNKTTNTDLLSRYPLKGASIQVVNRADNPGYYYAVIRLQPHSQLEGIDISIRLVAELPAKNN